MEASSKREALEPCDLVMKGGITSGVIYPGAVLDLAEHRRFDSVGGASAGAIAAAVTAAAEYGARTDGTGGFHAVEQVVRDLSQDRFLERLFQATPSTRPLLDMLLRGLRQGRSKAGRTLDIALVVLGRFAWLGAVALLGALAALGGAVLLSRSLSLWLALVALPLIALVLFVALGWLAYLLVRRGATRLHEAFRQSNWGMCPGMPQPGYDPAQKALTVWLHERIQQAAGLPGERPLTFQMLEDAGVELAVMTTDLSYARPLRLPFDTPDYYFRVEDVRDLFPQAVVHAMIGDQRAHLAANPRIPLAFPQKDLPVLVAVRMSLSFPLLLSAVKLLTTDPAKRDSAAPGEDVMINNWFSDGGIASNFPIHFFDSWLPSRPTFGLDLHTVAMAGTRVELLGRCDRMPQPRWSEVSSLKLFAGQMRDVAQNWRDNLQASLPGYRDRVCVVPLERHEGGGNLNMTGETIKGLMDRGREAGRVLRTEFDWPAHRWTRYLTFMQMMERNLREVGKTFAEYGDLLREEGFEPSVYATGHDRPWPRDAAEATAALLAIADAWGPDAAAIGFDRGHEPLPRPAMRITPRV